MSCLTTSATRRSRSVPAAVLIASAAASSHEVLLVPMISVTLYTLITLSFEHLRPAPGRCGQPFTETPCLGIYTGGRRRVVYLPAIRDRADGDHRGLTTGRGWPRNVSGRLQKCCRG